MSAYLVILRVVVAALRGTPAARDSKLAARRHGDVDVVVQFASTRASAAMIGLLGNGAGAMATVIAVAVATFIARGDGDVCGPGGP